MSNFQAPPTYAELLVTDPKSGKTAFNPIWLNWFISLTQNIGAAGPINSVTASAPVVSSGGANPNITVSAIPNTALATMGAITLKGNATTGAATPTDLAIGQGPNGQFYPVTDANAAQTASGIFAGTGAPNNANGNNGDVYIRSDGGAGTTIYHRRAGAWVGVL